MVLHVYMMLPAAVFLQALFSSRYYYFKYVFIIIIIIIIIIIVDKTALTFVGGFSSDTSK